MISLFGTIGVAKSIFYFNAISATPFVPIDLPKQPEIKITTIFYPNYNN